MQCAVELDFARYDRDMCAAEAEGEAIKEWAAELYDEYVCSKDDDVLPWIVDEVEEELSEMPEFWLTIRRSDWAQLQSLKADVTESLAKKYWEEEKQHRSDAQY